MIAAVVFAMVWFIMASTVTRFVGRSVFEQIAKNNTPQQIEARYQDEIDSGRNPIAVAYDGYWVLFGVSFILIMLFALLLGAGPLVWEKVKTEFW